MNDLKFVLQDNGDHLSLQSISQKTKCLWVHANITNLIAGVITDDVFNNFFDDSLSALRHLIKKAFDKSDSAISYDYTFNV